MRLKRRPLRLRLEIMELYDWKAHAQMRRGEDAKAKLHPLIRLRLFALLSSPSCLHVFALSNFASSPLDFAPSHFRISHRLFCIRFFALWRRHDVPNETPYIDTLTNSRTSCSIHRHTPFNYEH